MIKEITTTKKIAIRFNEVDSLGIVWHGNFVKYLEDGREDFGAKHGLSYLDFKANNHAIPIVKCDIDYKRVIQYGDEIEVETTYVDNPAAKLVFTYVIRNASTGNVIATAKTIQVFTTFNHQLCYVAPQFFLDWKSKIGILA